MLYAYGVYMSIQIHSLYRVRRILLGLSGVLIVASLSFVGLLGPFSQVANAFTANDRLGPNPDWYGHSARFVLENDGQVAGSGAMYIPIYIKNTGSVETAGQYPPTNVSIRLFDYAKGYYGATLSAVRIRYQVWNMTTRSCDLVYTNWSTVGSADRNFSIDRRCFSYREDINAWSTIMTAFLQDNSGIIHFRTQITSPTAGNEILGYEADTSKFAIGARNRCDRNNNVSGCGSYYNYAIPFGTPCSVASSQYAYAYIYDPDNPSGTNQYGIQPNGFGVQVRDVTNPSAPFNITADVTGSGGNGGTYTIRFTVQPSHKYLFRINGVYTNNVLQFKLPYDSIEYIADCAWDLKPDVTVDTDDVEPPISGIKVDYGVTNEGPGGSANVRWQLTRCRVPITAGPAAYGAVPDNTSNADATYTALGANCDPINTPTTAAFPEGINQIGSLSNESIGDEPVGTRVCYILSVNPPTDLSASNVWRHSTPKCVLVVKKPKVQILGNDLLVGKNNQGDADVQTSKSRREVNGVERTYGSWVEYAIAASGTVSNAASGAGFAGGNESTSFCNVSLLTFTNTPISGTVCDDQVGGQGSYRIEKALPDLGARLSGGNSLGADPVIDVRTMPEGLYTASGNNISIVNSLNSAVPKGKWIIINAAGSTVTIRDNISYTNDPLNTAADIPQVIIIADRINIEGDVGNIDAWLIARGANGYINTCSDVAIGQALTAATCNNVLVVNGPVISEKIYLHRTGGSGLGDQVGMPAEIFNLRPDAYFWATEWTASTGRLQTVYTKELPPRF
jgi:hypothetical protein